MRASRQERLLIGARFKLLLADGGFTIDQAAKTLHVTPRTIRYWISGRVAIPYAAYRLMRILGRYELPDPRWHGWVFHSGKLWSPENYGFDPHDSNWWGLLVRKARGFQQMFERHAQLQAILRRAGRQDPDPRGGLQAPAGPGQGVPNGEAGRAAQPPALYLSL